MLTTNHSVNKNTGSKTIATVHWAYFFIPQDGRDAFAYIFTTKINIPPGKETNYAIKSSRFLFQRIRVKHLLHTTARCSRNALSYFGWSTPTELPGSSGGNSVRSP